MRWLVVGLIVTLVGCAEPPSAAGPCAAYHTLGDALLVQFQGPSEERYEEWTIPSWSAYDVEVVRHARNGDAVWTVDPAIVDGCMSAPLDGPGEYRLTARAPVAEDDYCWFSAWNEFSYDGGLVEIDVSVGAVCA